ncbi:hypothetical protein IMZ48_37900 [Candidatus Bathyarchaeota archaeon]|nr:hypothetical protein [Candidatus Bathyarchaeota archaeon]
MDIAISNSVQRDELVERDAPVRNAATPFCETDEAKAAEFDHLCRDYRDIVKVGERPYPWTRRHI